MSEAAVAELAPRIGVRAACDTLGIAQAGYYRRHRTSLSRWAAGADHPP